MTTNELDEILKQVALLSRIGVIITDANGITEWTNNSIKTLLGYSRDEMVGKKPGEILQGPATATEDIEAIRKMLSERIPFEQKILNYHRSGRKVWVNLQITPVFDEKGELEKFIGIQHDITQLKDQNERLMNFNHIVSHNLVNQVNSVHNLIGLIQRQTAGSANTDWELLTLSSDKLFETVKSLKQLLTFENESSAFYVDRVNIHTLINDIVSSFGSTVRDQSVVVHNLIEKSDILDINKVYLESILHNLISNAIKYRDVAKKSFVKITGQSVGDNYRIDVEDNGIGMNPTLIKSKIFKAFQTFHDNADSIGFGLHMVKQQMNKIGGTVDLKTEEGTGTTFTLKFPLQSFP